MTIVVVRVHLVVAGNGLLLQLDEGAPVMEDSEEVTDLLILIDPLVLNQRRRSDRDLTGHLEHSSSRFPSSSSSSAGLSRHPPARQLLIPVDSQRHLPLLRLSFPIGVGSGATQADSLRRSDTVGSGAVTHQEGLVFSVSHGQDPFFEWPCSPSS